MTYKRVQKSSSWTPQTQAKASRFAPPPMTVQAKQPVDEHQSESQMPSYTPLPADYVHPLMRSLNSAEPMQERAEALQSESESTVEDNIQMSAEAEAIQRQQELEDEGEEKLSVQTKLTIGQPGDKYEQEADQMAAQIVQQINAPSPQSSGQSNPVQRQEMPPEEDELQMKPMVQRLQASGGTVTQDVEASIQGARGSGQPLADSIRVPMEGAFGADFSSVKVHTDSQSDQLNQSIQAKAFTTGQDIFFRQGAYEPGNREGQELIAHELTHVVQQSGGTLSGAVQGRLIQRTPDDLWNAVNSEQDVDTISQEKAKEILKNDFYSNWFLVRDYLVEGKWKGKEQAEIERKQPWFKKLMRESFIKLRQTETDKLLTHIRDNELATGEFENLEPEDRLKWSSAGSETLTSDIDVNLKGAGSIAAVTLFNQLFKTELKWPNEPGTVFDVNVYAQDFMEKKPFTLDKNENENTAKIIPQQEVELKGDVFTKFAADQDMWSILKMRIHMTQEEWEQYQTSIVGDSLKPYDEGAQYQEGMDVETYHKQQKLRIRFAEAEGYYNEYQCLLQEKILQINTSTDEVYVTLRKNLEAGKQYLSKHQAADTKKMAAANLIYQEQLDEVAAIRLYLQDLKDSSKSKNTIALQKEIDQYSVRLKTALSHSIVYANEAYFTQGAVHFSVIGQQIGNSIKKDKKFDKVELQLSDEEYLHSFREQVGDTLKVLHEYSEAEIWKAAYKAGKYIDRMLKSAAPLVGSSQVARFNDLSEVGSIAIALKDEGANSETQQSRLNPVAGVMADSVSGFRNLILQFGVDVEKTYQNNQEAKKAAEKNKVEEQPNLDEIQRPKADSNNSVGAEMQQNIEQAEDKFAGLVELARQMWGI
ncbi:DUF4157 domain-containing protein [Coleofasciculus sp. FACHB-SPT36]|uniref:eCIS core domain-containing protein n=1 Tax=Cyanophyceae TaxID=3028117 RepID=UPI0018EFD6E3|nr:DUF4157 domain-containing protein [Coleofasciculus sp. FACHB-SPT36]